MEKDYDFIKLQPDPELEKQLKEMNRKAMLYSILLTLVIAVIVILVFFGSIILVGVDKTPTIFI